MEGGGNIVGWQINVLVYVEEPLDEGLALHIFEERTINDGHNLSSFQLYVLS